MSGRVRPQQGMRRWLRGLAAAVAAGGLALVTGVPAAGLQPVAADDGPAARVVNGHLDSSGDFGFLVLLFTRIGHCTGSLVTPTLVVTAAHCLLLDGQVLDTTEVVVSVGAVPVTSIDETVRVSSMALDPEFAVVSGRPRHDVAVVTLATPVTSAPPVMVNGPQRSDALLAAGTPVRGAGWGMTEVGSNTGAFRVADMVVLPADACSGTATYDVGGITFYAWGPAKVDATVSVCAAGSAPGPVVQGMCSGDSGGPLIAGTGPDTRLVGVTSWGPDPCTAPGPSVFSRVSASAAFLAAHGVPVGRPGPPTAVTASPGDHAATVTWTAAAAGDDAVVSTTVTPDTGGTGCTAPAAQTSCTVTGLTNGLPVTFTAVASDATGPGVASAPSAAVTPAGRPPGPPTAVAARKDGATARVSWQAPVDAGSDPVLWYAATATATATGAVSGCEVEAPATECVIYDINGKSHAVTVVAHSASGDSVPSAAVAVLRRQRTVGPLGLPHRLAASGATVLLRHPVRTNAGRTVALAATCQPVRTGSRRACTLRRSHGRVSIWLPGRRATVVTVRAFAPATGVYAAYEFIRTYRTRATG